jgi:hypothetical protein
MNHFKTRFLLFLFGCYPSYRKGIGITVTFGTITGTLRGMVDPGPQILIGKEIIMKESE